MCHQLKHRGPDSGNVWVDNESGIALGHRRLAVIDLSPAGSQPMVSPCNRFILVYNGEIYNAIELLKALDEAEKVVHWRGHSDTEILLAAISCWGLNATLPRLTGMFAFALWDRQEASLTLVRDRLGEKPLYYGWAGDTFLFGSELKALSAHPMWRGEINPDALRTYLRFGYIPSPLSIFRNIKKLPPGCLLSVKFEKGNVADSCDPSPYWSADEIANLGARQPFTGSDREAIDTLENLLGSSVRQQMVADVPLGAFLSGGIDSSLIVALMQEHSPRQVQTFTMGFSVPDYNESEYAGRVARHLGTDHTELIVTPDDVLNFIPHLSLLFDEPFADSSQIPTFLVSRLARKHVTVSLSGDGGDELFGGYNHYKLATTLWKRLAWLPSGGKKLLARGLRSCPSIFSGRAENFLGPIFERFGRRGPMADKMRKLAELITEKDEEGLYLGLISVWRDTQSLVPAASLGGALVSRMKGKGILSFEERMMVFDMTQYLPDDILVKVDRAAMGVSLETRIPLLDHRIVEFALRLPLHFKIREGSGKWILKQILYRRLPREFFSRPKRGFAVPLDSWLRGPLREWADELLSEERLRNEGILNPQPIRDRWRRHLAGEGQYQTSLWTVLMFQAWHEAWQKKSDPFPAKNLLKNPEPVVSSAGGRLSHG